MPLHSKTATLKKKRNLHVGRDYDVALQSLERALLKDEWEGVQLEFDQDPRSNRKAEGRGEMLDMFVFNSYCYPSYSKTMLSSGH